MTVRWLRPAFADQRRDPTALPRVERPELLTALAGGPFYLVDRRGGRWEVFDLRGDDGTPPRDCQRVEAPSSFAAHRIFLFREGTVRVYSFRRRELRGLPAMMETRLQRQLEQSSRLVGFVVPPAPWQQSTRAL
jgi:hypothetical protein